MRRTYLLITGITAGLAAAALARSYYHATLFTGNLSYNRTFTVDLSRVPNAGGTLNLSAQAVYSTATIPTASFTDGRLSTGAVTAALNTNLAATAATNQITIAPTATILAAKATDYLLVLTTSSLSGKTLSVNENPLVGGQDWAVVATTSGTADNIKAAINRMYGIKATRTNNEVDLTATQAGAAGNAKTLAVNTSSITIGGATFAGGHNNRLAGAYITVHKHDYYQGGPWLVTDTSSGTAKSIASMLNRIAGIKAAATGSVVYATATVAGAAANAFAMSSSAQSYATVAGANFSGGIDNAKVCINGTCLTQGTDWTAGADTAATTNAIAAAIKASAPLSAIVSVSSATNVVTLTAKTTGPNYALTSNAAPSLTVSGAAMTGGTAAAWEGGGSAISVPAHGFNTALAVVYSTSSGTGLAPLVPGTTYYTGVIDGNTIALSSTSAQAQAGTYIGLTAPLTTGPHTFKLTPQVYAGSPGLQWFVSNDGSNYNAAAVSSVTYSSPSATPASTVWDFGKLNYRYVQLQATAPTGGALNLTVTANGD